MVAEAGLRLGWLGLIYAGGGMLGYFGRRALLTWNGTIEWSWRASDVITMAMIALGIAVYVVAQRGILPPRRLFDLGPVFEVAGAFGIASSRFSNPMGGLSEASLTLVPAECIWIVVFPLVVPNTPRNVLIASLVAASLGPATVVTASAFAGTPIGAPLAFVSYFLPNYLAAVIAYTMARIVHRFSARLKQAREIGSYELIERIGEGGMGEVWRATHRLLARPAALKLIRSEAFGSSQRVREATVRRFEREAQDTAALGSTHTVDVYDFGVTEEGDFYYVMELLDGITFQQFVQLFGPMEPARVLYLLQQVCHSLGEAHARGFLHRDIKPANIFLCRLGPDVDFVKVLDFGLVKHLDAAAAQTLTVEGTTAGTPSYMAPEIALGRTDVDGRADLYSLACVAYVLLTGQPVFSGGTAVATVLAHINETPMPPSRRSEVPIPPALDALILECLAKDPASRPPSAVALGRRLAAIVPADPWTPERAQAWWDLHGPAFATNRASTRSGIPPRANVPESQAPRRCWPRLHRRL
jgi:serine/threonine protein kinase